MGGFSSEGVRTPIAFEYWKGKKYELILME